MTGAASVSSEAAAFGPPRRTARGSRTPVIVVTGFLGSGKTTLIRRFLDSADGNGTAIIVNEFGEVGIDHVILRGGAEATVLLGNGCLCCALRSDLEVTLRELLADAATGRIPSFRRVIVETSGLAEPGPILQTFAADAGMARMFHVDAVLTLVDAVNGADAIEHAPEARRQIALADRLVLTKTDLAGDTVRLLERLCRLNPLAEVVTAQNGVAAGGLWAAAAIPAYPGAGMAPVHSADVGSFVLRFDAPVSWSRLAAALDVLMQLRGADLLRIKGLLAIEGCRGPVVVQAVQHVIHSPMELDDWPGDDRKGRLVFITRGVSHNQVAEVLGSVLAL